MERISKQRGSTPCDGPCWKVGETSWLRRGSETAWRKLNPSSTCYGSELTHLPRLHVEGIVVCLGTIERCCDHEEVRARGRKLVLTSGHTLEGNTESPVLFSLCFLATCRWAFSLYYTLLIVVFCFSTDPKTTGPCDPEMKPETKSQSQSVLFTSWFFSSILMSERKLTYLAITNCFCDFGQVISIPQSGVPLSVTWG